MNIEAFVKA